MDPRSPLSSPLLYADYVAIDRGARTWLIDKVLPVGGSMILYGPPKRGKSFAAVQLASALATGDPWFSLRVTQPCRVVFMQLDTSPSLWVERITNLHKGGIHLDKVYFCDPETLGRWPLDILSQEHRASLAASLKPISPDVVIIDTVRKVHYEDEDKATVMNKVIAQLKSTILPAALTMIMHSRKDNAEREASLIDDIRGSNFVSGDVDSIARLTPKTLWLEGRAIEEQSISLSRLANGAWQLNDQKHFNKLLQDVLSDPCDMTTMERAERLSVLSGKTIDACRQAIYRKNS